MESRGRKPKHIKHKETRYELRATQEGLYSPYDAEVIGDFAGLTLPFDYDAHADNGPP
jgi:hypothetical protein